MPRELYQDAILARAREATGAGTLDDADAIVTVHNPLCGDRITLALRKSDGTVAEVRHEVRGCVLCQAAASIIAARAPGRGRRDLVAIEAAVRGMLADGGALPPEAWTDLSIFAPVAAHKSRHECVLLPFEALHRALDAAGS
ncbi:MAG TPA: iron-sulfur cluster assembly scaffold protein [Alphaproteobacteria bacterium]|nr:iron-sulfur cluster assembly scaffold protein [Alphaproteobacteria bacterium]